MHCCHQAMSEDQLAALLAKLKEDVGLLEKLKAAADLDSAAAIAKEAGYAVSKADWLKHQAKQTLISDEVLEDVAGGGKRSKVDENCTNGGCLTNGMGEWDGF